MAACLLPLALGYGSGAAAARTRPHLYHLTIGVNTPSALFTVNRFLPSKLTIHAGDSVSWTNADGNEPQTVTFGPVENTPALITGAHSPEINPLIVKAQGGHAIDDPSLNVYSSGALLSGVRGLGIAYTFTFPHVGSYLYRSLFHPLMQGEIDVVPAGHPASSDPPDSGDSAIAALRSTALALADEQSADAHGADNGNPLIYVGFGNSDVSLNTFTPAGVQMQVGQSVKWIIKETSGDPHAIVFAGPSAGAPLYTGLSHDGGLTINPTYANATSATQVTTDTVAATGGHFSSGILYGSSPAYPSQIPTTYSLTFLLPGQYVYFDPFHGMLGRIYVAPAP